VGGQAQSEKGSPIMVALVLPLTDWGLASIGIGFLVVVIFVVMGRQT
jgi:hypothetical protein